MPVLLTHDQSVALTALSKAVQQTVLVSDWLNHCDRNLAVQLNTAGYTKTRVAIDVETGKRVQCVTLTPLGARALAAYLASLETERQQAADQSAKERAQVEREERGQKKEFGREIGKDFIILIVGWILGGITPQAVWRFFQSFSQSVVGFFERLLP